ncbi:MAG: FkbM family methyltransferase [Desulfobacter sp.]
MFKKILEGSGYNCIVKARYGYMLYNKNDTYIGRSFDAYGEFSEGEAALFRQLCESGDRVVDIGANIGAHTLVFSGLVGKTGRVYAYEPQRVVFQSLCANMAINSIENVECSQMVVSSSTGHTRIPDIRYDLPANHGGFQVKPFTSGVKTQVAPLDELLDLPHLKLIKIDVEGMEREVIEGAEETIRRHHPFLYVENDKPDRSRALIEKILELDYRLFWHPTPLFNPENYAKNKENIYGKIVSLNMLCFHRSLDLNLEGFQEILDPGDHPMKG